MFPSCELLPGAEKLIRHLHSRSLLLDQYLGVKLRFLGGLEGIEIGRMARRLIRKGIKRMRRLI